MKKVYPSKIGWFIILPLILLLSTTSLILFTEQIWPAFMILLIVDLFVVHLFLNTKYTLTNNNLIVQCGFLYHRSIDIQSIHKIIETTSPLSAPALSTDRLELYYNTSDTIVISPRDKQAFVRDLLALNKEILAPADYTV